MDDQQPIIPTPTPTPNPTPVQPQTPPHLNRRELLIGAIAVVALAGGIIYYYETTDKVGPTPPPSPIVVTPLPTPPPTPILTPPPPPDEGFKDWMSVTWEPKLIDQNDDCSSQWEDQNYCGGVSTYLAGVVTSGKYQGKKLYLEEQYGMGTSYAHFIGTDEGREMYLHEEKIGIYGVDDVVKEINFPLKSGYKLSQGWRANDLFDKIPKVRKLFTHPVLGDFYLAEDGCIIVELPDHTALSFEFDYSFINDESGEVNFTVAGKQIQDPYDFHRPTCAANCYYWAYAPNEVKDRVEVVGKNSRNEDVYALEDPNDPELQEVYNDKYTVAFMTDDYKPLEKNKYTYSEFLALNPLLYWYDPLDRLIEFRNRKVAVAAEMCKPVIYLYPETIQNVRVTVKPNGGFTKTEPNYGNGWNVLASPSGKLLDFGSGRVYDYLFWEGMGLSYPRDDRGFVVSRENIKSFLDDQLPKLGLQGQEIADFEAYWIERLSEKPYYQLSFVRKAEFDEIAPLSVSGNPDNIIRVMMTAQGLNEYREIAPQNFDRTPIRQGFVVVEWGGVLFE